MGCGDSTPTAVPRQQTTIPQQNFNNNTNTMFYQMQTAKRPRFLNPQPLHPVQLQKLWAIIQRNSLNQLSYMLQSQNIPSNVEAGPPGAFWNFAHFCARWDAFECLHYLIKRIYAQNRTQYMSFINQQSIQGYTPIHVAIQWNAINCFHLIIDCGAVDLSYKDKANNDVFAKVHLFKRQQMLEILQKFRAANCLMILLQSQKTYGFKTFSQIAASGQMQTRPQYRITNERILQIIDTRDRMNRPPPPPPAPPKQNIQKQYQNLQNNLKNIEQKKRGQSLGQGQGQSQSDIIRKKLQQQRRFRQNQEKMKRQKAEQLKKYIQQQKIQEENRIKNEVQIQNNKYKQFQKSELQKIEKQKQIMRKNIQMMYSGGAETNSPVKTTKLICPQDIKPFYQKALKQGKKFVDSQFPPQLKSIGDTSKFKFGWQSSVWLRPAEMFPGGKFEVFDGISPDDVKQGTLAVCYYLALLSSIAQNENRIKQIFRFYDKQLGFYAIQLYKQGKPTTMIVDDLIPCMKGTNQPLFAKPRTAETWVMVLQKAWAKMFGNYLQSQNFSPPQMFQNVLPSPCTMVTIDISKIQQVFDQLVKYDKQGYIMVTSSNVQKDQVPGIVENHAYSLIGVYNINGIRLAKLRNPWAKTQYSGAYSQDSTLWTPQLKKAVGFKKSEDGQFFLTDTQMHTFMPIVSVSLYRQNYQYSFVQIASKSNQEIYYMFTVKSKCELAIKVTQQNQRFRKNMEYQNCRILFQVIKVKEGYEAVLFSEGQPSTCYGSITTLYSSIQMFEKYEPGKYIVRLKVFYDRTHPISTRGTMRKFIRGTDGKNPLIVRQGTCVLSIYSPQSYVLYKISAQQGQKYMRSVYRNEILNNPKVDERLRSVGQDLKPMILAKCLKMKNQVIYCAQNWYPNNQLTFKFIFNHKIFRNVSYAYNVDKEKECCQWVLNNNGGWNLCTLQVDFPVQQIATEAQLKMDHKIIR